ncbi:MAG: hypothetical protein ABIT37_05865 [Luteolibacter sp.]
MNKTQIIAALIAAGFPPDESLTVEQLKAFAAENGVSLVKPAPPKQELVTVRATANLNEDGVHYKPDESFETTPERADALGPLVVAV